jgi:lactate racemase
MKSVKLPYGEEFIEINPAFVERICSPAEVKPLDNPGVCLNKALLNPVGCAPLPSMLLDTKPDSVAIVIDDNTRPTPCAELLPPILKICNDCGIPDKSIKIIIALGTHRPMSEDEIIRKVGRGVLDRVMVINSDYESRSSLTYHGLSESGVPIWINKIYSESDFKIALGGVVPHGAAGFSGGAKIIYPGIAGRETVEVFHKKANSDERNALGEIETPIRLEIESMVKQAGLDFVIQTVPGSKGNVSYITAGDPVKAHRDCAGAAREILGIEMKGRAKTAIASSYPADNDFWQAAKCIFNCQRAVEDGGWLIAASPCWEGIPREHALFADYIGAEPEELAVKLEASLVEDPVTAAPAVCLGRFRKRINIGIISKGLAENQIKKMGFLPFKTMNEALETAFKSAGRHKAVVFTHGGESLPIIKPLD